MNDQRTQAQITRGGLTATHEHAVGVQVSNATKLNRYPAVFKAASQIVARSGIAVPRILSFGSSTGEEAHTLSTLYFPKASILGLDIADDVLTAARETYGANPNLQFEKSGEYAPDPESFDLIFAMSVLCRWPDTRNMDDISAWFPFANFEKQTDYLDSLLKPGGLMVIYNASYSFLHSRTSRHYDLIVHPRVLKAGFVKRFRKDGKHDPHVEMTDCLYRKQPEADRIGARGLTIRDHALTHLATIERDIALD